MVRPGQIVILDGGTTTLQLAMHLPLDLKATVITHSPTIAVALVEHPSIDGIIVERSIPDESLDVYRRTGLTVWRA
jgi:DeoR/GlpR family transcriptional regulator of sugar metabolism